MNLAAMKFECIAMKCFVQFDTYKVDMKLERKELASLFTKLNISER